MQFPVYCARGAAKSFPPRPRGAHMLMVVCKRSPGIPSDDRRFVDIWADDSLTVSADSSLVTVVEVHAQQNTDETTLDEAPEDELDEEKIEAHDIESRQTLLSSSKNINCIFQLLKRVLR